jgi:hypothetical protein
MTYHLLTHTDVSVAPKVCFLEHALDFLFFCDLS